ncbi:hypothetical protein [uncultured Draconibacterium sp.]|uniref:hypothetical protein n=1 Tax=uncultured Draconibacterium sp. TaxID=1573823 RepID=UPI0025FDDF8A|nr:hypothetical protein [uncultured Draconibacterium sp.]
MKISFLLVVLLIFSASLFAQVQDTTVVDQQEETTLPKPKLDKSRIYYGGYVSMNFSKNYSVIGAQPLVAYKLTPKLSAGTQVSYEYVSYGNDEDRNGSNYGASIFSRYRVTPRLYAHTEFELMSYKFYFPEDRKLVPMFYVGGGYSQPISRNTWLNAQVLFDVLNHENSPYKDWEPYFSIGVGVGF